MCGLVGVASRRPQSSREWLAKASLEIQHRGPDDSGEWWSANQKVGLGHRRLSIIDLSSAGHQPMLDAAGSLAIVFNGEIYNYGELKNELSDLGFQFQSSSDTEVILAAYQAWGSDCLARFNGMFAFGLFDAGRQRLFMARDRAGEKPLFYHCTPETIHFASELKALFANPALPRVINPESLNAYLGMGYVAGANCLLAGYQKLPPAHALFFDLETGVRTVWRYWQVPEFLQANDGVRQSENELVQEVEHLLEAAVRGQMVADVPVGVLLSGGVDSSLITAMALRAKSKVKTFTVGFPGHGALDERQHARLIANYFGTEHIELEAPTVSADILKKLAWQFDEPIVDSSMIPTYLVSQLVRQHCKVALGGDGGDELFGGYGHYSRLLWMQQNIGKIPFKLRQLVGLSAEKLLPIGFKGRNWLQGLGVDLEHDVPTIASYFDQTACQKLLPNAKSYSGQVQNYVETTNPRLSSDLLQRATRRDFENYLAEDILVKVDRSSMLNSLEIRAPFLDVSLIEFAFSKVPSHLKANARERKILLKRLSAKVLPPQFDRHRKQGFSIPLASWLKRGEFRDLFHSVLLNSNSSFDRKVVRRLLDGQDKGRNNSERLFALTLFELWREHYRISF
jgi:asparagine synthase (glutamine-hydrolysing)